MSQGGTCTYQIDGGQWIVNHNCLGQKTCVIPSVHPLLNFPHPLLIAGDPAEHHIQFTQAQAVLTVAIDRPLVGTRVKVCKNMKGPSGVVPITPTTSPDGNALVWEIPASTLRFGIVVACDGEPDFGLNASSFDFSQLPPLPVTH